MPATFTVRPKGQFDLKNQNQYFGSWPTVGESIVMAFPVEGWRGSAAVQLSQRGQTIHGRIVGPAALHAKAKEQALAALSLDVDGAGWAAVGKHDPFIGQLQQRYRYLRPVLFHSPYEAAAHFVIAHRIRMLQARTIRARMAEQLGASIKVDGATVHAFPLPQELLKLTSFAGLNALKVERLHAVAHAALDGRLDRERLRSMPIEKALVELQEIPGIGPFFASAIVFRGAGVVDQVTEDHITPFAVKTAYKLKHLPTPAEVLKIAERWKPYRMWALVQLHVWVRREVGLPKQPKR
ncbi:MAG: hypothetical protein U0514_02300 [Candidatus Andersenbacteria bacterium]